jgi:hypothetical protein
MSFPENVERWRGSARRWAQWANDLYHAALDESWILAVVQVESGGDPTIVSPTGYRGLGQVGAAALSDYNNGVADSLAVDWEWLVDADHGDDQIRVVAWHQARGRAIVAGWGMPDAASHAPLWADARYGWGGGHLRRAISDYEAAHGVKPTFDQLAAELPDAGAPNVRPWHHARHVADLAAADGGRGVLAVGPIGGDTTAPLFTAAAVVPVLIGAGLFLGLTLLAVGIAKVLE